MYRNNNVTFLVDNYRQGLRKKVDKSQSKLKKVNSNSDKENTDTSVNQSSYDLVEKLSTHDLNFLSNMAFLKRNTAKPALNIILDPIKRFKQFKKPNPNFKKSLKDKLKEIEQKENHSVNQFATEDLEFKKDKGNNLERSFWNSTVMTNQKKTNVKKKVSIMVQSFGINLSDYKGDDDDLSQSSNSDEDIGSNESKESKRIIKAMFDEVPHTLLQFPDEVDPLDFFTQYNNQIGKYLEYLDAQYKINSRLSMLFCNDFDCLYSGYILDLTDQMKNNFKIEFPFAASYMILNFPPIAQLCFFNNYVTNQLKKYKRVITTFQIKDFSATLKNLCGIETRKFSALTLKSKTRKSIFGNAKLNMVFGDKNNSSEDQTESQIISQFESKLEQRTFTQNKTAVNTIKNKVKSVRINKTEENIDNGREIFNNIHVSDLNPVINNKEDNSPQKEERDINNESNGFNNRSSEYSGSNESYKTKTESEPENEAEDKESEKSSQIKTDTESSDNSDIESQSLDESESDSDSDDSLAEEEYASTNPFEIKYSKINFKFKVFELKIEKPAAIDFNDKHVRDLKGKDVYDILMNRYTLKEN